MLPAVATVFRKGIQSESFVGGKKKNLKRFSPGNVYCGLHFSEIYIIWPARMVTVNFQSTTSIKLARWDVHAIGSFEFHYNFRGEILVYDSSLQYRSLTLLRRKLEKLNELNDRQRVDCRLYRRTLQSLPRGLPIIC